LVLETNLKNRKQVVSVGKKVRKRFEKVGFKNIFSVVCIPFPVTILSLSTTMTSRPSLSLVSPGRSRYRTSHDGPSQRTGCACPRRRGCSCACRNHGRRRRRSSFVRGELGNDAPHTMNALFRFCDIC
jgi:hypothetical protein